MYIYIRNISKKIVIKYLRQSVLLLYIKRNQMATKPKTHYETLGIPPTSTFNEIKSAYYELTLKYHPDKNKSKLAKEKFHEISNAYDVLSKHDTRKQYDKTLLIKYGNVNYKGSKLKYEESQMKYTTDKIYDFDEWLKNHYTQVFMKKKIARMKGKGPPENKIENTRHFQLYYSVVLLVSVLYISLKQYQIDNKDSKKK